MTKNRGILLRTTSYRWNHTVQPCKVAPPWRQASLRTVISLANSRFATGVGDFRFSLKSLFIQSASRPPFLPFNGILSNFDLFNSGFSWNTVMTIAVFYLFFAQLDEL